jgi:signal peptidase I
VMNEEADRPQAARVSGPRRRRLLRRLLLLLALALVMRRWVGMPTLIQGNSMLPALRPGQIVWINKLIFLYRPPHRGEVVALWTGTELMVKRVLALPGEDVMIRDGVVSINGAPLAEPYVQCRGHLDVAPGRLGAGRFVVAGDNRPQTVVEVANRGRIVGRLGGRGARMRTP